MDSLVLFILMVAGVLLSAIVSKYIPQIPLALIQIMIGLLLAIVPIEQTTIHFEPELFMIGVNFCSRAFFNTKRVCGIVPS